MPASSKSSVSSSGGKKSTKPHDKIGRQSRIKSTIDLSNPDTARLKLSELSKEAWDKYASMWKANPNSIHRDWYKTDTDFKEVDTAIKTKGRSYDTIKPFLRANTDDVSSGSKAVALNLEASDRRSVQTFDKFLSKKAKHGMTTDNTSVEVTVVPIYTGGGKSKGYMQTQFTLSEKMSNGKRLETVGCSAPISLENFRIRNDKYCEHSIMDAYTQRASDVAETALTATTRPSSASEGDTVSERSFLGRLKSYLPSWKSSTVPLTTA